MPNVMDYIQGATSNRGVQRDLLRLYQNANDPNSGLLSRDIMQHARNAGHATELSSALQRIEERAGKEGNFGLQRQVDQVQQEYDRAAAGQNCHFRSGDRDGVQNYDANPNLASAQRAAANQPTNAWNAAQASSYLQGLQQNSQGNWDFRTAGAIDRMQKGFERDNGIHNSWLSQDPDRFNQFRSGMQLYGWLRGGYC